jgi:hypothetical protein
LHYGRRREEGPWLTWEERKEEPFTSFCGISSKLGGPKGVQMQKRASGGSSVFRFWPCSVLIFPRMSRRCRGAHGLFYVVIIFFTIFIFIFILIFFIIINIMKIPLLGSSLTLSYSTHQEA